MSGKGPGDGDFGFQVAPMVDVVFVLLLFFMACAGQNVKEGFFSIGLPTRSGDSSIRIFIDIDPNGNVFVNALPMSISPKDRELVQLREHLTKTMQLSDDDSVIVRPSPEARHERVVDVLQACRTAHVKKLSFG